MYLLLKWEECIVSLEVIYSKRHNKFLFPSLAGAIYGSSCNAENEISNVVNYKSREFVPHDRICSAWLKDRSEKQIHVSAVLISVGRRINALMRASNSGI